MRRGRVCLTAGQSGRQAATDCSLIHQPCMLYAYLPVTEDKLRVGQSTCLLTHLVSELKALDDRKDRSHVEGSRSFLQIREQNPARSSPQYCIHFPYNKIEIRTIFEWRQTGTRKG